MGMIRDLSDGRAFRRDPLSFMRTLGEWRNVMRFRAGFTEFSLINHPDLIRRVLVTDAQYYGKGKWSLRGKHVMRDCLITREGTPHRERRKVVGPNFDPRKLAEYGPALVRSAERLTVDWHNGQLIETRAAMGRLLTTMAGIALFDADLEDEAAELYDALGSLNNAVSRPPLPRPGLNSARRRVERTVARLSGGHLTSHLRDAGLSEPEVMDEVVSLLMAAVHTTPRALMWIWYLLGRHPSAESRLHQELATVLAGHPVTVDDLPRLGFLNMVLNEALRLYPPVHFIDRRTLTEVEFDGVRISAGAYLLLSPLITHRDPRFFDDPGTFDPDRWNSDSRGRGQASWSFPFGAGSHRCIGEELARLEITLTLATIAQHWRLRPSPELAAEPSPQTAHLPMIAERRA